MFPLAYFVRHGQTDWNVEVRLQGQADIDINARGIEQAIANGRHLACLVPNAAAFDFVASPLRRTMETMRLIRSEMGLPPDGFRTDPRLKELHFGGWQGFTFPELESKRPGSAALRAADKWGFRPPGSEAESYAMLAERVRPWLAGLVRPTIAVVHGGVMRVLFHLVEGMPGNEAANVDTPQDRILALRDGHLVWL